jgi:hypothetical protein
LILLDVLLAVGTADAAGEHGHVSPAITSVARSQTKSGHFTSRKIFLQKKKKKKNFFKNLFFQ